MNTRSGLVVAALATGSILLSTGLPAEAAVVTIPPDRDNSLFENDATASCGIGPLFAGQTGPFGLRRALIHFDVDGSVPSGSTITSVQLEVTVSMNGTGAQATDVFKLHRLTTDWGEKTSECFGGTGAPAQDGDATWSHARFPTDVWNQSGGDFSATPSASIAMPLSGNVATWTSTAALVADVQSWLDAPSGNFGWIVLGNEVTARSARLFQSHDSVSGPAPSLRIEYTAPPTDPPGVPDGSPGSPVRLSKLSPNGADVAITWDGALCAGTFGHHIIYGTRAGFPTVPEPWYELAGSVCGIGTSPPYNWIGSPDPAALDPAQKLIWILVLANDGTATEGSWGRKSNGVERDGVFINGSSNTCGILDKSLINSCGSAF